MFSKALLLKSKKLPNKIGVYLFLNDKKVLYVGKSKKIRTRVKSYFKSDLKKNNLIVSYSNNIEFILVDNEEDALFLENNLIKKYKPKYNILLKDDKNFPWICIKNERFPRVFICRKKQNNSDFYFGPYFNNKVLKKLLEIVFDFYPVRSCNFNLSENNILSKKYKVCLDYHLKKCLGPCEGYQNEKDYDKNISSIKLLLEGRYYSFLKIIKKELDFCSKNLLFERCESLYNLIKKINYLKSKSVVVSVKNIDLDCFYILNINNFYYINFIRIIEGSVLFIKNYKIKKEIYFSEEDVLSGFIKKILINYNSLSKNLISNININFFKDFHFIVPKIGYKKTILELSKKNIIEYIGSKNSKFNFSVLVGLKKLLFLKNIPFFIHCFDVSNLNGTNTTASCVVFKNGYPLKSEYRSYKIKNVIGPDDYFSLSEAIEKKYKKFDYTPDLIIIDGGKGQLNTVLETFKKLNFIKKDIISIAKKEEIVFLENNKKVFLNKKSSELKLIQYIRDEAHRFCLKHHRIIRNKKFIKSDLNNIKGIGNKTIFQLLNNYKTLKNIKNCSKKELIDFIGIKKGNIIYKHFNN